MPKNVAAVFTYILFVSGFIWNENIILYIAFYWLCELFFTIPKFSFIYIHTKESTQLSQFEWFWNRNQDRQKFPVWIVWLFKKQQNMFSVWTTQKYVLPENAAQKKPGGGKTHLCLSLLNRGKNIRKKCWFETEFLFLLPVVYAMTKYSSTILFPGILFCLPCSWSISGKEARWNNY